MGKIIGIDLGSTMSAVAVCQNGKPEIIVNQDGERTTPSVIGYGKDGEIKVGSSAKRQSVVNSKNTIEVIKRFIGNSYKNTKKYDKDFSYDIIEGPNDSVRVKINDKEYTPQEISAEVLRKLKSAAEDYLGETVTDAVITVPAYFDDQQRTATIEAAKIAGLECKRIINEPTAACLAFGYDKADKNVKVLVLDLGGSTADVSLLEMGDGVFEVLSTQGDMVLGGRDLDNEIAKWMIDECQKNFGYDVSKDPMAFQRVVEAAEKAKIDLSSSTQTEINLPYLMVVDGVPQHFVATLTRAKFEQMMTEFMKKVTALVDGALKAANMKPSDVNEILLVGGTTRVPKVQEFVKSYFGKDGNKSVNPDEAVALGAAVQGAILSGDMGSDIVLLDVTPMNLNITTLGGIATVMIPANTTIPTSHDNVFSTAEDNQTAITVVVTQGNRKIASENKQLGVFNLEGIAPARRGVPQINVKFDLDANGVLTVTAKDQATGKEQNIRIEGSSNLSDDELDRMRKDAEAHEADDKAYADKMQKFNAWESQIFAAEQMLSDDSDKISEENKKELQEKLDAMKAVFNVKPEERDMNACDTAAKELQTVQWQVSDELYKSANPDASTANPFGQGFDFSQTNPNTDGGQ
jgi:molecular chaperone DnaK